MFILHAKDLMSAMRRLVICAVYKYIFYSIDLIPEQEYERLLLKITPGILTPPEYKVLFQHRFQSKKNLEVIPFLLIPASTKRALKHFRLVNYLDKILLLLKFVFQHV